MPSARTSKVGLACAGGVIEGSVYEIGALCALEEAIEGIRFTELDVYVGVSAGAVVNALLANGISPRTLSRGLVGQASDPLLNVDFEMLFTPAVKEYQQRLRKLPRGVLEAVLQYAKDPLDLSALGVMPELGAFVPVGIFDNDAFQQHLAAILADPDRTNEFDQLKSDLFVVAVDIDTAEVAVFGRKGERQVPISKAVQASTALPMLYCPVEIDGAYYVDGVARRTVHASLALKEGTDLLFCINPIVPVHRQPPTARENASRHRMVDRGLLAVLSQTFRSLVYSRMQAGFRSYEHLYPDADIILIEPDPEDMSRIFSNVFSYANRQDVCRHAYRTTRTMLLRQADRLGPMLERHGFTLRVDVLEDGSRSLYARRPEGSFLGRSQRLLHNTSDVLDRLDNVLGRLVTQLN